MATGSEIADEERRFAGGRFILTTFTLDWWVLSIYIVMYFIVKWGWIAGDRFR